MARNKKFKALMVPEEVHEKVARRVAYLRAMGIETTMGELIHQMIKKEIKEDELD